MHLLIELKLDNFIKEELKRIGNLNYITKDEYKNITSIGIFLENFTHYNKLSPSMRKLFNEINKSFSYNYNDKSNIILLKEIKKELKNESFSNIITLQPSFMGFGIDLIKLKNIIFKRMKKK